MTVYVLCGVYAHIHPKAPLETKLNDPHSKQYHFWTTDFFQKLLQMVRFTFFFFLKKESLSCVPLFATPWSLPGSSVHGISQVRILKWVVISFSRGSSRPRDGTWVSCIAGRFFTIWAMREDLFIRGECLLNTYSVPNLKLTLWHILLLTIALSKQVSRS